MLVLEKHKNEAFSVAKKTPTLPAKTHAEPLTKDDLVMLNSSIRQLTFTMDKRMATMETKVDHISETVKNLDKRLEKLDDKFWKTY